jgi:hypothetical protein
MALTIAWTVHALERLPERGLTRTMVEQAVRDGHPTREKNEGEANWRVNAGGFSVLYDHPTDGDLDTIRIVTAWPRRRKHKRHLQSIDHETESYPER